MLLYRVITAVVAIPLLTAAIVRGGDTVFLLLVLGFGGAGLYEFMRAALPADQGAQRALGTVLGLFMLCCVFAESRLQPAGRGQGPYLIAAGCIISCVALFVYSILNTREITRTVSRMAVTLFGIFYVGLFFSYLLLLYAEQRGPLLVMFLLCVTWGGDAAAYFIGTWKGRHPLCPRISPKKTIEGAAGGLLGSMAAALICHALFLKGPAAPVILAAGAGINIMNQLGDISESLLKRAFGIKDSGALFPGHGGVLDRIDSILFAAPFFYYWVRVAFPL
jgi:phosphatidate cytidylyltransferase